MFLRLHSVTSDTAAGIFCSGVRPVRLYSSSIVLSGCSGSSKLDADTRKHHLMEQSLCCVSVMPKCSCFPFELLNLFVCWSWRLCSGARLPAGLSSPLCSIRGLFLPDMKLNHVLLRSSSAAEACSCLQVQSKFLCWCKPWAPCCSGLCCVAELERTSPSPSSPSPGRWPSGRWPRPRRSTPTSWRACTLWAASGTRTNWPKTCCLRSEWGGGGGGAERQSKPQRRQIKGGGGGWRSWWEGQRNRWDGWGWILLFNMSFDDEASHCPALNVSLQWQPGKDDLLPAAGP